MQGLRPNVLFGVHDYLVSLSVRVAARLAMCARAFCIQCYCSDQFYASLLCHTGLHAVTLTMTSLHVKSPPYARHSDRIMTQIRRDCVLGWKLYRVVCAHRGV